MRRGGRSSASVLFRASCFEASSITGVASRRADTSTSTKYRRVHFRSLLYAESHGNSCRPLLQTTAKREHRGGNGGRILTSLAIDSGRSFPLGASVGDEGTNFSVFSKNCSAVELLLFDHEDDPGPSRTIPLDPICNRTFYYWHAFVPGIRSGQLYGFRVHGPYLPNQGHRFDGQKVLLDPYARLVATGMNYSRSAACGPGDNSPRCLKGIVFDPAGYDWEGDVAPRRPLRDSVIYELHVGGFTRHPSSDVSPAKRGTYAGLMEKIRYLKDLGATAVELLPVQQFDDSPNLAGMRNYWGYAPVSFFAPHRGYSSRQDPLGPADEFRDMVKAMHRAGIEVILDMVFNHTAEAGESGPTFSFRGFENRAYYIPSHGLDGYANFSGCGNTFNSNHSIVRRLILDALRWWVTEMHVDGFRFDLASILSRDEMGEPLLSPPVLWRSNPTPFSRVARSAAEPWDAGGLYQVGGFIGHRWAEWNGRFRDDLRRFAKGDAGMTRRLSAGFFGSPDLFAQSDRDPYRSVHFVSCHDGFTLYDLVSFNSKHNESNGEENRDGTDANFSWNCGAEGATDDPAILSLRARQMKNMLAVLLLSHGTPMLSMGDELARTQFGNNNAYCQDNAIGWMNWAQPSLAFDLRRFVRELVRLRQETACLRPTRFLNSREMPRLEWHGVEPFAPDWEWHSRSVACSIRGDEQCLYIAFNAYWEPISFRLPSPLEGETWLRSVDTALASPFDICESGAETLIGSPTYRVEARSAVVLISRRTS
ncbi:MAG: glycogen debranching protein GlgX [Gemmataceae bacterium]